MDFVVNHQSPLVFAEKREVYEWLVVCIVLLFFVFLAFLDALSLGKDLVGCHGDGAYLLDVARVFLHLVCGEGGLVEKLADPLSCRGNVRGEDKRAGFHQGHCRHADKRLARSARENDDARAALFGAGCVEYLGGVFLVTSEFELLTAERYLAKFDRERVTGDVARDILDGKSVQRERHLENAALVRIDNRFRVAVELYEAAGDIRQFADFLEKRRIGRF